MQVAYVHRDRGKSCIYLKSGRLITFQGHIYSTADEEEIRDLEVHPEYGIAFKRVETAEDLERVRELSGSVTKYRLGPGLTVEAQTPTTITEIAPSPKNPTATDNLTVDVGASNKGKRRGK